MPFGDRPDLVQELRDVLYLLRERLGPLGVLGVVAQKIRVLFHRRTATGGVDDHIVQALPLEGVYGLSREVQRLLLTPSMSGEGAATALVLRGDNLAALSGENPDGGGVNLGEKDLLHAADENAHLLALL